MITILAAMVLTGQPGASIMTVGACAALRTEAADRRSITVSIRQGGGEWDDAAVNRLVGHVADCTPEDSDPTADEIMSAGGHVARNEMRAELDAAGIDFRAIERWFARQDDVLKTNHNFTDVDGRTIMTGLAEAGIPSRLLRMHNSRISTYIGLLIGLTRIERGLSME